MIGCLHLVVSSIWDMSVVLEIRADVQKNYFVVLSPGLPLLPAEDTFL